MTDPRDDGIDQGWFAEGLASRPDESTEDAPERPEQMDQARWERLLDAIATYRREISATVDPRRRAALCFEVGRIYEQELRDDKQAITSFQRAFAADPTHVPTLRASQRVFGRAGRWTMVLRLLDAEIRARVSAAERARLLWEKGQIYLTRFEAPDEARVCFEQALDFDPRNAMAARALTIAAALSGDLEAFARATERAARVTEDPAFAAALQLEAADAWHSAGAHDQAARLIEAHLARAPDDGLALARLADVHRHAHRWDDWFTIAARLAELIGDPAVRAARRAGLADLAEELLDAPVVAIGFRAAALVDDPSRADDRRRLALTHLAAGDWPAADAALSRAADEVYDAATRIDLLWRLAELRHARLGDKPGAIAALRRLLALDPAHGPAVRRIRVLLSEAEDWGDLAEVLALCITATESTERAAIVGLSLAELYLGPLEQLPLAASTLTEALTRAPRCLPIVEALADAQARLGDWSAHVETLEHTLTLHRETSARVEILKRIAEVAERKLNAPLMALGAWVRVRGFDASDVAAMHAIGRLKTATEEPPPARPPSGPLPAGLPRSRAELWLDGARLIELHIGDLERAAVCLGRARAAASTDPAVLEAIAAVQLRLDRGHEPGVVAERTRQRLLRTQAAAEARPLAMRLGALLECPLNDVEGAIAAYEQALEYRPNDRPATRALQAILRRLGRHRHEAEWLEAELAHLDDDNEAGPLLARLATIHADALVEPELAVDIYERALAVALDSPTAEFGLIEAHEAAEDHEALLAVHRRLAEGAALPAEGVFHWAEVARIAGDELDEPGVMLDALGRARQLDPTRIEPLIALERRSLLRGDLAALADLYDALTAVATTAEMRAGFRVQVARIAEDNLDDLRRAYEAYESVLAEIPEHVEALEWMEGWADEVGDVRLLADVLERRLQRSDDPHARMVVMLRTGRVLRAAGQLDEAAACYRAVLGIDPRSSVALRALREVYEDLGEREKVVEVTEMAGRVALDNRNAAALFIEAGRNRELDNAALGALDDYLAALERDPGDDEAAAAVRRICERAGRWQVLVDTLERRAGALPERRDALLHEVLRLYTDRLRQPREAIRVLKVLIPDAAPAEVPRHLQRLADLYAEVEDWPAAVAAYERLRAVTPDTELRRAIALRLVAIHRHKRPDAEQARAWLRLMLEADPGDVGALEALADLELAAEQPGAARIALARAVNAADPGPRRAGLRRRIARMDLEQGRIDAALVGLDAAVEEVPDDPRLLEALADACLDAGRAARARAALQRALAVADPRSRIAERLRQRVAEAALAEGTDPTELIKSLRSAISDNPDDSALRALFADALGRRDDHVDEAIAQLRWLLGRAPLDDHHLRALVTQLDRAGQQDTAAEVARLRVAIGIGRAADARLIEADGDGLRPLIMPLEDDARGRLWGEVDAEFLAHLRALVAAAPSAFGPRPPHRAASEALVESASRLSHLLGARPPTPLVGPIPLDVVQGTGDGGLIISDHIERLPGPEQAFCLAVAMELARRGVDVVTRWTPVALRGRIIAIGLAGGHTIKGDHTPRVRKQADRLRARLGPALARPVAATALQGLVDGLGSVASEAAATLAAARRVGLLAAGSLTPALAALERLGGADEAPGRVELARFGVGATYAALRARYGMRRSG